MSLPEPQQTCLAEGADASILDVRCPLTYAWSFAAEQIAFGLVLFRRGCLRRRTDGLEALVDPTVAYFVQPGQELEVAHPAGQGIGSTTIVFTEALAASIGGGEPRLPARPIFPGSGLDLAHRRLLADCRRGLDAFAADEAVHRLAADVLSRVEPDRVASGRPATGTARRRLADGAREALVARPDLRLLELARELAVSPHHLSRVFGEQTGLTLSRFRTHVRVRAVLERLSEGETSLARLAAELGFADHAHLTRVVRAETGMPPSRLRDLLGGADLRAGGVAGAAR